MPARPNVLFILADQHNAKVLSCKGHPDVKTPRLDRLASQGVRFDNAIVQNPICTPSRVCYISGQYAHNHGYYGLSGPKPKGLPTIFGHFRRHGYRTAAIGKIHCPEYWVEDDCDLFEDTCSTSVGGRSKEYAKYLADRGLTDKEDHAAMQEFGARGRQTIEGRPSMVSYEDGQEGWSVRKACEFMGKATAEGNPFFVHVSLPKPHQCYTPAQQFWDLYDQSKLTLPPNADYDMEAAGKAPHLIASAKRYRTEPWQLFEPKTFEAGRMRKLQGYLGNVSHVDHAVGELLDWLDANGLGENTIVVYAADHGDFACEHGQLEKAPGICADAITRVPMMWRWPGRFKTGHVERELVESVDVSATLCALAGLPALETSDGKDISPLLAGQSKPVHRASVTEFALSKSIRKGQWRMVFYPEGFFDKPFGELYDIEADPWEMKNLFFDSGYRDIVADLTRELVDWLASTTRVATVLPMAVWDSDQAATRYQNTVNADGKISPTRVNEAKKKWPNYI
ncbi:MAG: sulfatase-like hydrolase/transferase [Planctomycetaceae bacterium]|nr:sulfatase-like hydrolase/transferase [Planctomycetaceae bacterium]